MNKVKILNEFIDGVGPLTGADVLLEDLRQICIFKEYSSDHWWEYIANFPDDCFTGNIEKCSEKAMVASSVSQKTIKDCVDYNRGIYYHLLVYLKRYVKLMKICHLHVLNIFHRLKIQEELLRRARSDYISLLLY